MRLRYWLTAPTVGEMLISLSLSTMTMRVLRWPMSLSASSDRPLMRAASPTTTAMCSRPPRRSRARARPSAMDRPVPAWPPSMTSCADLRAAREAAHAAQLAQRVEALQSPGQELVRVGLVTGVPDDPVGGAGEDAVQGDRELHDPQRAAQVAARHGDRVDDAVADLRAEGARLRVADVLEVLRSAEVAPAWSWPTGHRRRPGAGPPGVGRRQLPSTSRPMRASAPSRRWAQCSCRAAPRS